jgi:K+-transporting ATPase ATPase C chain
MLAHIRPTIVMFTALTLITGVFYPGLVTLLAQALFHDQANGSLIHRGDRVVGSRLIGQPFDDATYFWSRLSATAPVPYNAAASSGSNLGPLNPAWTEAALARAAALRALDPDNREPIPVDLVTSSGSGLDPHITPAAAEYQVARVARARGLDAPRVRELVVRHTQGRAWGLVGEPRVNVLEMNLALDEEASTRP